MGKTTEKLQPSMLALVPWAYAHRRWLELHPDARYDPAPLRYKLHRDLGKDGQEAAAYAPQQRLRAEGACPTCDWPAGERGFVRFCFPAGHELFGRPICCPECWPEPYGEAPGVVDSELAVALEPKWQARLRQPQVAGR